MRKQIALALAAVACTFAATAAHAGGHVSWSVGFSAPGVSTVISNGGVGVGFYAPPVVYAPQLVYYAPPPVYYPPQVVYAPPQPVYGYPRVVYAPQPYYRGGEGRGWEHRGWEQRGWEQRGHDHDGWKRHHAEWR